MPSLPHLRRPALPSLRSTLPPQTGAHPDPRRPARLLPHRHRRAHRGTGRRPPDLPGQARHRLLAGGRRPLRRQAVDGDLTGTRWASQWSDPQWIRIDLGAAVRPEPGRPHLGGRLRQGVRDPGLSDNGTDWTTIRKVTDGDGGTDDLALTGSGRYVRMLGTARGPRIRLLPLGVPGVRHPGRHPAPGRRRRQGHRHAGQLAAHVDGQPYTVKGLTYGPPQAARRATCAT